MKHADRNTHVEAVRSQRSIKFGAMHVLTQQYKYLYCVVLYCMWIQSFDNWEQKYSRNENNFLESVIPFSSEEISNISSGEKTVNDILFWWYILLEPNILLNPPYNRFRIKRRLLWTCLNIGWFLRAIGKLFKWKNT